MSWMCHLGPWVHGLGYAMERPWGVIRVTWGFLGSGMGYHWVAFDRCDMGLVWLCLWSVIGGLGAVMRVPWVPKSWTTARAELGSVEKKIAKIAFSGFNTEIFEKS